MSNKKYTIKNTGDTSLFSFQFIVVDNENKNEYTFEEHFKYIISDQRFEERYDIDYQTFEEYKNETEYIYKLIMDKICEVRDHDNKYEEDDILRYQCDKCNGYYQYENVCTHCFISLCDKCQDTYEYIDDEKYPNYYYTNTRLRQCERCGNLFCWTRGYNCGEDGHPCKKNPNQNLEYYIGDCCGSCSGNLNYC